MAEQPGRRTAPNIYSIAAHRGFADALVAGLTPRYSEEGFGLARLTLLLPSRRTMRAVTEAFVRASDGSGLLLPRMAVVGDLDLDETLGPLLDPMGSGAQIPPAADPTLRWLRLAELLGEELGSTAPSMPALLRMARGVARSIDRLAIEDIAFHDLLSDRVLALRPELAEHWQESLALFLRVHARWSAERDARGEIDAPERRNRLLAHAARRWEESPPQRPIVAAGVTSASPAVAQLLRSIAFAPAGAVILPELDLTLDASIWDSLGVAGAPTEPGDPPFSRDDHVTHPQYHLKLLLNRMGIAREEVRAWHRSGEGAAPPERSRAISNLFLPPEASAAWVDLPAGERRLSGVRLMESVTPEEEAQAIALLIREAVAEPERRVALITPDRSLATRVVGHLARWNIIADDSAGRPLSETTAGRVLLLLADCMAERFAPVALLALLGHPLVDPWQDRAAWLDEVRRLDQILRGPRPMPGLTGVGAAIAGARKANPSLERWWPRVAELLAPIDGLSSDATFEVLIATLCEVGTILCGPALWGQADGRALATFVEGMSEAARLAGTRLDPTDAAAVLRDAMVEVAVRPPWGGHPRVAVYGLIEARMQRADLVICAAMHEGSWPSSPAPDPLLAPAVLRVLGVPGADFRVGLAAHDLAAALGAPQVVLSHSARDAQGPVIASRFLLRIRAMLGPNLLKTHREERAVELARRIDRATPVEPSARPRPRPSAEQRRVDISATALDRLRGDPFAFYASSILGLSRLDPLDAEPSPAWLGTMTHGVLEQWHKDGDPPGELEARATAAVDRLGVHPFMRATWLPRLQRGLAWVEKATARMAGDRRRPVAIECPGSMKAGGVTINGKADRIDQLSDGTLAIIDYKTGKPPSNKRVEQGFSLQLGVLGLIADAGGFEGVRGKPERFEYWSLARNDKSDTGFGALIEPIPENGKRSGIPRAEFLSETRRYLDDAIARWIAGDEPFVARLNPDLPNFGDYDQLMRLDEWQARGDDGGQGSNS